MTALLRCQWNDITGSSASSAAPKASEGPKGSHSGLFVALTRPEPRKRLLLRQGEDCHLVTCRVVATRGHLHAVFFTDRQPPVVLLNNLTHDLEVNASLPA